MKKKHYYQPTPKKWRKIGDALFVASGFITASAIAQGNDWLSYTALFLGIVGKILTNFFSDEN